jgi:hypothetical protein
VLELDVLEAPLVEASVDELVDGVVSVAVEPVVVLWSVVVCGCATIGVAVSSAVTAAIGTYRMLMVVLSLSGCSASLLASPLLQAASRLAGGSLVLRL